MPMKDDLLFEMLRECDVCTFLHGQLPEGALDHRPTPGQRSTLELLRYLSFCGPAFLRALLDGNWDAYAKLEAEAATLAAADFPAAMARQKDAIRAIFREFTDADLDARKVKSPTGEELTLGRGILDLPVRFLVGYRMQLFLYAKAAGASKLGTAECWWGTPWPSKG